MAIPKELMDKFREASGNPNLTVYDDDDLRTTTSELQTKLGEQQAQLTQLQAQINDFNRMSDEELLKNPKVKALLDKSKKSGKPQDGGDGNDAALQSLRETLNSEFETRQQQLQAEIDFWKGDAVDNRSKQIVRLEAAKQNFSDPDDAIEALGRFVKVVDQKDDKGRRVITTVVDERGNPRFNTKGEAMSVADLVTELARKKPYFIKGQAIHGSGAGGGSGAGAELSLEQQLAEINKAMDTAKKERNTARFMQLENQRAALQRASANR